MYLCGSGSQSYLSFSFILLLFDDLAYTKYILPERCSDE